MGLFEGEEDEVLEEVEIAIKGSKYLEDPQMGLLLLNKILSYGKPSKEQSKYKKIVNSSIFPILAEMELTNELEIYRALIKLGDRISEQNRIKLLNKKRILGIGGKFSAGKSCFINSITNAELPEGQRPTTSIATYVVNSNSKKNIAILSNDISVTIDDEAMEALTHEFSDKYNIGFSTLIKTLAIHTPNFTYPNIAILDTPGYSKSDTDKSDENSDKEIAREQLKAIDHLIWLVDAVQGVITQKDCEFIQSLNVLNPILVVFTKADLETAENLEMKIEQARKVLDSVNIEVFDIIAYDSIMKETIIGGNSLNVFLNKINNETSTQNDLEYLEKIRDDLDEQLKNQCKQLEEECHVLDQALTETSNVEHIRSLINHKRTMERQHEIISEKRIELAAHFNNLCMTAFLRNH